MSVVQWNPQKPVNQYETIGALFPSMQIYLPGTRPADDTVLDQVAAL
jgi:hypothetical protein